MDPNRVAYEIEGPFSPTFTGEAWSNEEPEQRTLLWDSTPSCASDPFFDVERSSVEFPGVKRN